MVCNNLKALDFSRIYCGLRFKQVQTNCVYLLKRTIVVFGSSFTCLLILYSLLDNGSEDHDGEGLSWHQLQPLLKTLRSCSNVQHLILGLRSYCCFHMGSLVELVRKYLPQISTLTINDTDETGYSLHSKDGPEMSTLISNQGPPNPSKPVGIFAFENLQKITFDMKVSISSKGFHARMLAKNAIDKSPSIENMKVFLEHMPKNKIKEVCFENGHGDGLLNENFVMKLRQIFPCMEKLVIKPKIDSWDRDGKRCVIMPKYLVRKILFMTYRTPAIITRS